MTTFDQRESRRVIHPLFYTVGLSESSLTLNCKKGSTGINCTNTVVSHTSVFPTVHPVHIGYVQLFVAC